MGNTFNPDEFLNASFDGANSTERIPTPEGEYVAIAKDVKVEQWISQAKGLSGMKLVVKWLIDDAKVKEVTGQADPTVRQDIMLDLKPDTGGLDMGTGKNVSLGRLREAVGLNQPGKPFSFSMIQGQMAKVKVSNREHEGQIYDEIKGVAKI